MRNGFTFNGRHTSEFAGVTVKTKDRPVFPSVKEQSYGTDEMNGEYDFTDVSGHEYFNTRKFQIDFNVKGDDLRDLQKKITKLCVWFKGRGTLIFDDLPLVKWNVRVIDSVSYMPEHGGLKAVLSVTYKAFPFSELVFDLREGPRLDDAVELDSEFPIDGAAQYLTFSGSGTYKYVPNIGDVHVKPVITVTGAANPFTIGNNGVSITVKHTGNFVIDCGMEIVYSADTNLADVVEGEFFELAPGTDNTVTISENGTAKINYVPLYLYDADFDNVDWGD